MKNFSVEEISVTPWGGSPIVATIEEAVALSFANEGATVLFVFNGKEYRVKGRGIVDAIIEAGKEVN
jgi:hypothetical protein